VQAFVHKKKPVYGTQFHPESSNDIHPDGFTVLTNFFTIAREYQKNYSITRGPGNNVVASGLVKGF